MAQAASLTLKNERSWGKPNEDDGDCRVLEKGAACGAVLDGIPMPRKEGEEYPAENGRAASRAGVMAAMRFFSEKFSAGTPLALEECIGLDALKSANEAIRAENIRCLRYDQHQVWWLGAVGIVGCGVGNDWVVSWIGDPIGIHAPQGENPILFTDDGLASFRSHLRETHGQDGYGVESRLHQDKFIRNNTGRAFCFCGAEVAGWGALTGEEEARVLPFIRTRRLTTKKGDVLILASDAMRPWIEEEGWKDALRKFASWRSAEGICFDLMDYTRGAERRAGVEPDDATFVVFTF